MLRGPSRDGSDDGRSAETTPARGRRAAPTVRAVRLLHLLAFAIVTVVCAGLTSPARGIVNVAAPIAVAARDGANAVRWGLSPQPSHQWRDAAHPLLDLKAIEADLDDDD